MKFKRINLEIINTCNLKCSFCPTPERAHLKLSVEQFVEISSQLVNITDEIVLHLLGEPLSHPQLELIINEAQKLKLPVNIVTNGLLLSDRRITAILNPIVRQVSISLQSFTNNFPEQDPGAYLKRVKSFVELAEVERPDLYINLRFWDLEGFTAKETNHNHKLREIVAEEFKFSWEVVLLDVRKRKNYRIRNRIYLHFDSRFVWPSLDNEIIQTRGFCHGLTGHIGIHADGTLVPCCLDHNGDIPLGNVFKQSVAEILDSPRAKAMREGFKSGQLVEDLCKRCGYIGRFEGRKSPKSKNNIDSEIGL